MRMGNLFPLHPLPLRVSATRPTFGIAHPTVVPTNFDREGHLEDDHDGTGDETSN
jgi:hypothetical protein